MKSKGTMPKSKELPFSALYTEAQARRYFHKHRESLRRRLSHWQEERMIRRALKRAGDPKVVLDLPCGAGRFWPLLSEDPTRVLLAGDYSGGMLAVARRFQPPELLERFALVQTSAFHVALADDSVDGIVCIRLLHHIGEREDRLRLLRELRRVTRKSLCISLWLDDNRQGRRRRRLERARARGEVEYRHAFQDRFVQSPDTVEEEFVEAGFRIEARVRMLPGWSIWSTYVLIKS